MDYGCGSEATGYSTLRNGGYIHVSFDPNPQSASVWTPTSYSEVPEPSGGLLTAVGLALLALRRRQNGGA